MRPGIGRVIGGHIMKKAFLCLAFATLLVAGNCAPPLIDPPMLRLDGFAPPIPDATVVMTNSRGEKIFEGTTNASGRAEGTQGPGRMDHELDVTVVTPGGKTMMDKILVPQGWELTSIYVNGRDGTFTPHFRKPPPRRGDGNDSDSGDAERD